MSRTRTEPVVVSALVPRKLLGYGSRYHAWRIKRRLRKRWLAPKDRLPTPPG